jgi:hypothetical protein
VTSHPAHRLPFFEEWSLWKTVALRGAGFPIHTLEPLAAPELIEALDDVLHCEAAHQTAREKAKELCRQRLQGADEEQRKTWRRANRLLKKGRMPEPISGESRSQTLFRQVGATREWVEQARQRLDQELDRQHQRVSEYLREVAGQDRLREAVAWQNPHALRTAIDPLARSPIASRNQQLRSREELLVSYLQRYCAKNDSIGFFGPFGWAQCQDEGPALSLQCGPGVERNCRAYFEYWAIDALVQAARRLPRLWPWLFVSLHPWWVLAGPHLVDPRGRTMTLQPGIAQLLDLCDGRRTAGELARALARDPGNRFQNEQQVMGVMDEFIRQGALAVGLNVPVVPRAERILRHRLTAVGDSGLRDDLLAKLDDLTAKRDAVLVARGESDKLLEAIDTLEVAFANLTGKGASRHQGQVYAGRALVYADCNRDVELRFGPDCYQRLGPSLSLVLRSARWYSREIGQRFGAAVAELHAGAAQRFGSDNVPLTMLWGALHDAADRVVNQVAAELQERWAGVLDWQEDERHVQFKAAELRQSVEEQFAAPAPGWPQAHFQSPDLMLAAKSEQDIAKGSFLFVMGETHANGNTLMQPVFLENSPDPNSLLEAYRLDQPLPQFMTVIARNHRGHRVAPDSLAAGDLHLAINDAASWRDPRQVVAIGSLILKRDEQGWALHSLADRRRFPLEAFYRVFLGYRSGTRFKPVAGGAHVPRITIDQLVLHRETWQVANRSLHFVGITNEAECLIAIRKWVRALGLPRWVFMRFASESKPIYVDLESPVSLRVMVKALRQDRKESPDGELVISEMLPTPEQCWLTDKHGQRYSSELRLVLFDDKPIKLSPKGD